MGQQEPNGVDTPTGRAIEAADELFTERGVGAVSMADIRDQSRVSMRRLYSLFPHKSDLISAWLAHRHTTWSAWFELEMDRRTAAGTNTIDALFDLLAEWLEGTDYRGCAFLNTLGESGTVTDEHRRLIVTHKTELIERLAARTQVAEMLAVLIDGALIRAALFESTEPVEHARAAAHTIVNHRTPT